jgi:hypothetical protein
MLILKPWQNYCVFIQGAKASNASGCRLIVLMGPVGVGKTTLAYSLISISRSGGVSTKYSYIRLNHVFAYVLTWIIARLLGKIPVEPLSAIHSRNPLIFKKLFKLWLYTAILSLALKYIIAIDIPIKFYKRIFVEDYLVVTVCDLVAVLNAYKIPLSEATLMLKLLTRLLLKHKTCIVLLRVSTYNSLIRRWAMRGSIDRDIHYAVSEYSYIKFHDKCAESLLKTLIRYYPENFAVFIINDVDKLRFSAIIDTIINLAKTL